MYNWPLNINNFNLFDRIKICLFFLNYKNRWTSDKYIKKFEEEMAKFIGCKYAVFTSSGSTANTILAMHLKDGKRDNHNKNIVVFPSTTWSTSITPFVREGFEPKFIDINLDNLSIDLNKLADYLKYNHKKVECVFITSLLGFVPDMKLLLYICNKYKVKLYMDNCECNFGTFEEKNISSIVTSTTSTYFGHQLQSVEGGFIFTNDEYEYKLFKMYRNHGMTRSVEDRTFDNPMVNPKFDFYLMGNNFRNSDINALIGLLDFNKRVEYIKKRKKLYSLFGKLINHDKYLLPLSNSAPFAIPIIINNKSISKKDIINWCENNSIETRPIISGNLLRQTCFKHYDNYKNFVNSEFIDKNGLYVGLHNKLKDKNIIELTNFLNNI